jgi:asparagine synthase (glutamine-hydrolysing)
VTQVDYDVDDMCGIAGIWGSADRAIVERIMGGIEHRGPDGSGVHVQANGVLGHRRLAIMDPEGGAQPLYDETHGLAIVANGEIYNFPDLRPDLAARHAFKTTSDIEAVLHLYEECGVDTPSVLKGMFTFAICAEDHLFLARDPIGIKPLYYGSWTGPQGTEIMAFGSEMKPLAAWVDDLHEFPAGHYFDSRVGFVRYYEVPTARPVRRTTSDHIALVRRGVEDAVASHMMSDVPVGAFLSGGLDSSVIAAIARKHVDELHTFSVGVAGSSDLEAARRVAAHIGSIHHEYIMTPAEVIEKLPEIITALESFDQDLVRSAIPTYFCSRLAAEYVKVILTGEGADELFAGYAYHKTMSDPATLHQELCRSVTTLHNINLQRADRLTMLHSIEGRVPFLDTDFIALALTVPTELKLTTLPDGQLVEKWILRITCADLLPDDIVWRTKEQFDEGTGTIDLLADALVPLLADIDLDAYRAATHEPVRSAEEALYHRILCEGLPRPDLILRNVARWTDDRHG